MKMHISKFCYDLFNKDLKEHLRQIVGTAKLIEWHSKMNNMLLFMTPELS